MFNSPHTTLTQFNIEPGMKVADLGCGTGAYAHAIAERVGPTGTVYALDVQKNLIESLSKDVKDQQIPSIVPMWDDLDDADGIALKENSVDRAVITNSFFQIDDKQKFALEVQRIIKPGGHVLVVDWSDSFGGIGPTPQTIVTKERALEIFQKAGFHFLKDVNSGEHHYGFIVQCKK